MLNLLKSFALLAALATPAAALEPGGVLVGTVGDLAFEAGISPSQSEYYVHDDAASGGGVNLLVSGMPKESDLGMTIIGFSAWKFLEGSFDTAEVRAQSLSDSSQIYAANLDDGLIVKIEAAVMDREYLHITGTIEGALIRGDAVNNKQRDPSGSLPIMLHFDAVLPPL